MENSKKSIVSGNLFDKVYSGENYLIKDNKQNNVEKIAVLYFSSSGIYFPNTEEMFSKAFVENDKYEFLDSELKIKADKEIYIRDIAKQFYITGISQMCPDMDSLFQLLKKETEGFKVITVGSSAGGYAATLIGYLLNAELIYCFSGYFNLEIVDRETWFYVEKYKDDYSKNKYYKLKEYIKSNKTKLIYFYPKRLKDDVMQAEYLRKYKNEKMVIIGMNSGLHGVCIPECVVKKLFESNYEVAFQKIKEYLDASKGKNTEVGILKYFFGKKWIYYAYKEKVYTKFK